MKNFEKYERQYFMPPEVTYDWVKKEYITAPPIWCSVDLRDGNQALIEPMSLEEKLEFFQLLVEVGFKEIEVGFPAASETEYNFMRALIERDMIPDDVTVQVLTQAREHIIRKTFEALKGAKNAIVHVYNSTSLAQREQVFHKSKEEILEIAVEGAKLLNINIDEDASYEIARRSRGTPRIANRFLKRVRDFAEVLGDGGKIDLPLAKKGLTLMEVDDMGLDYSDRKILTTMIDTFGGGPVGLDTLAASVNEDSNTIEDVIEPYLMQVGFVARTPRGRICLKKAYDHLGKVMDSEKQELFSQYENEGKNNE